MNATVTRTASGKEQALVDFYRQLRRDGLSVSALARRAFVGRAHLTQVLNGKREGRETWKHVLPALSDAAVFQLKQCSAWNEHAAAALVDWQAMQRAVGAARMLQNCA